MAPLMTTLRNLIDGPAPKAWGAEFIAAQPQHKPELQTRSDDSSIADLLARFNVRASTWRGSSVKEALGHPAIQRAVSLISGTTGMITVQAFRNGGLMDETPRLVARPDPFEKPATFYSGTAANIAKYGEFVWYRAQVDGSGLTTALINVPLKELTVEDNPANRLYPVYTWGEIQSTRYTPGGSGLFVHHKYPLGEPFALRGEGPLQLCGAAVSVAVEAQEWAAQFYADGGMPALLIKVAHTLGSLENIADPDDDEAAAVSEAQALLRQWTERANNGTRIIDQNIEDVKYLEPNVAGAQMLDARNWSNGDAARMFGMPGSLLEYSTPGSSLTYQNVGQEMDKLTRVCLQPLYFEPIEQAMSDLLPRTQAARFNVKGFLRADAKTRFEVHKLAIDAGIYDAEHAAGEEGLVPGDPEYAPILFSPPTAIPSILPIQTRAGELRVIRCPKGHRVGDVETGARASLWCRHCKESVAA